MLHKNHICMVYAQCGYRHGSSNYHFVRIVHHRYHICMVSHQCGCGHAAIRLDCVNKRVPKVPHLNCFTIVQVFTFPAILNILPQGTCFHSKGFYHCVEAHWCLQRYTATKSALVHDWIILSETCKAQVPLLKFVTNVSVKMQALTHHVFVKYYHKRHI